MFDSFEARREALHEGKLDCGFSTVKEWTPKEAGGNRRVWLLISGYQFMSGHKNHSCRSPECGVILFALMGEHKNLLPLKEVVSEVDDEEESNASRYERVPDT
ncbi:hypothetical protein V6N13_014294 [Hibiscus sabdariffa]